MIKKTLGILICILGIINISNAYTCTTDGFPSTMGDDSCFNIGDYTNNNTIINNNFNFYNTSIDGKIFTFQTYGIYWREDDGLHYSRQYFKGGNKSNGTIDGFFVCEGGITTKYLAKDDSNCTYHEGFTDFGDYIGTQNKYYFYANSSTSTYYFKLCLYTDNKNSTFICIDTSYITQIGNNIYDNSSASALAIDNPFILSNGNGDEDNILGIELGSNESGINYFENRYGWNENICYVGVDNMTDLWGSSVSFQEGSGLTIFEAFEELYGNTDLDKVYVWINSRLINYGQWFGRNGDPLYLASYNSGTNQVDLRYENLTFPFINNPVAVYFMSDYITRNSEYDTMGSEIVSYCNLKINDGNFDEIIDQAVKNNITSYTEQSNKNKGLNSDGTVINIDFSDLVYTGDAFISSGVEIAFSGNTTLKNTLKEFFTTFDNALDGLDINTTNRILPTWLVSAFLFVVLFNFLRKRK